MLTIKNLNADYFYTVGAKDILNNVLIKSYSYHDSKTNPFIQSHSCTKEEPKGLFKFGVKTIWGFTNTLFNSLISLYDNEKLGYAPKRYVAHALELWKNGDRIEELKAYLPSLNNEYHNMPWGNAICDFLNTLDKAPNLLSIIQYIPIYTLSKKTERSFPPQNNPWRHIDNQSTICINTPTQKNYAEWDLLNHLSDEKGYEPISRAGSIELEERLASLRNTNDNILDYFGFYCTNLPSIFIHTDDIYKYALKVKGKNPRLVDEYYDNLVAIVIIHEYMHALFHVVGSSEFNHRFEETMANASMLNLLRYSNNGQLYLDAIEFVQKQSTWYKRGYDLHQEFLKDENLYSKTLKAFLSAKRTRDLGELHGLGLSDYLTNMI